MQATHPATLRDQLVVKGAFYVSIDSRHLKTAVSVIQKLGLQHGQDWYLGSIEVQTPCPLTPHIPHRTSRHPYDYVDSTYYRFPAGTPEQDIRNWLEGNGLEHRQRRCHHEYDCCGYWYCDGLRVYPRKNSTMAIVTWTRNI